MIRIRLRACALLACVMLLGGCAAADIKPSAVTNPPPAERFASFARFEVKPIQLASAYSSDLASRAATDTIQRHLSVRLDALVAEWNATGRNAVNPRTLSIEPRVERIKYLPPNTRFWAGAAAGNSGVVMRVRYVEVTTGKVVADPEFYQHAAAMGGAWSFGATDQDMLKRIADLVAEYTARNYSRAVGGPTGATADLVQ